MKTKVEIKMMEPSQLDEGLALIWRVFEEFVAPDYTEEGIKTFYEQFIAGQKFRDKFISGAENMYGAYLNGNLAGVLSLSRHNTISCVFVDGSYHHMGVGKKLFSFVIQILKERGAKKITLNASPYALPFYHFLGFQDTGTQSSYHGIVYTPMELILEP